MNMLFVFHRGFWDNERYLAQIVIGEDVSFDDPRSLALHRDGLFAETGWVERLCCFLRSGDGQCINVLQTMVNSTFASADELWRAQLVGEFHTGGMM